MGESNGNPLSLAKRRGETIVKVVDLGDDYCLAGCRLQVVFGDEKGESLAVLLLLDAGKNSSLVGVTSVPTVIAELGRISVADLKAGIARALLPQPEPA